MRFRLRFDAGHGPPLPPLFFVLLLGSGLFLDRPFPLPYRPPWIPQVAPLLLILGASALMLSALTVLQRSDTPIHPTAMPRVLTLSGPFRFTRNPIYLGLLLCMVAASLIFDTLWLLLAAGALATLLSLLVIPGEEKALESVFGSQYAEYRRRVRRWI